MKPDENGVLRFTEAEFLADPRKAWQARTSTRDVIIVKSEDGQILLSINWEFDANVLNKIRGIVATAAKERRAAESRLSEVGGIRDESRRKHWGHVVDNHAMARVRLCQWLDALEAYERVHGILS